MTIRTPADWCYLADTIVVKRWLPSGIAGQHNVWLSSLHRFVIGDLTVAKRIQACDGDAVTVNQWCPDCDCMRVCIVLNEFTIECQECFEPMPLSGENAELLRDRNETQGTKPGTRPSRKDGGQKR
jgi:hypothetical protein